FCSTHQKLSKKAKDEIKAQRKNGGGVGGQKAVASPASSKEAKKRNLTPEGRRRLSQLMKARWAEKKAVAKAPTKRASPKKSATKKSSNGKTAKPAIVKSAAKKAAPTPATSAGPTTAADTQAS